jgi:DNA-binding transcriptional regulator YhcF (GntR family)
MINIKKNHDKNHADRLAEHLEALIGGGSYRPGDKLPTLRELADEFRLSTYSVHRCFKKLEGKALITLRHGSGAYVTDKHDGAARKENRSITVLVGTYQIDSGYLPQSLMGIQQAAMLLGCPVTLRKRDYYEFYSPEPPLAQMVGDASGLIFLGEYDYLDLEIPGNLPTVGIEMTRTFNGAVSPVSLDPMVAAELAVKHFLALGKKKVRVFYLDKAPAFQFRADCFRLLWASHGEVELESYKLAPAGAVHGADDRDVGLLFCGGSYCQTCIVEYRRETGRELTADFDVLSIDGKSLLVKSYDPVSTISIDWRAAGDAAFRELMRRLDHPEAEARRIYLIPQIFEVKKQKNSATNP